MLAGNPLAEHNGCLCCWASSESAQAVDRKQVCGIMVQAGYRHGIGKSALEDAFCDECLGRWLHLARLTSAVAAAAKAPGSELN